MGKAMGKAKPMNRGSNRLEALESRTLLSSSATGDLHAALQSDRSLTVMSQNLYLGADLAPLFAATSTPALLGAVSTIWAGVQATDFAQRAEALADQIAAAAPELLGLQEATLWTVDGAVQYDYVALLVDALAQRGLDYTVAASVTNATATLPDAAGQWIGYADHDVILARADLPASALKLANPQAENFQTSFSVPIADTGLEFQVLRGWTAVDAKVRGKSFRLINTHLETFLPMPAGSLVQLGQAMELLTGPADTNLPVVLLGDFNSDAYGGFFGGPDATETYPLLIGAGFTDAWVQANGDAVGLTWGQAADLRNPTSTLTERIDHILLRGALQAQSVDIVGDQPADKTPSGLWPSDHAGVVATLQLQLPASRYVVAAPGQALHVSSLLLTGRSGAISPDALLGEVDDILTFVLGPTRRVNVFSR